jgi:hypothetical protein
MKQHLWSEGSLYVFYRIVRKFKIAEISEDDERKMVAEDLKNPIGTYRFVLKGRSLEEAKIMIGAMRKLLSGFNTDLRDTPDKRFQEWLDKSREKNIAVNEGGA